MGLAAPDEDVKRRFQRYADDWHRQCPRLDDIAHASPHIDLRQDHKQDCKAGGVEECPAADAGQSGGIVDQVEQDGRDNPAAQQSEGADSRSNNR